MKIYVRRRHIEGGVLRESRKCPIALAFEEMTGTRPQVEPSVIWAGEHAYDLPASAQKFITDFDSGKPVKPFAFTIRA